MSKKAAGPPRDGVLSRPARAPAGEAGGRLGDAARARREPREPTDKTLADRAFRLLHHDIIVGVRYSGEHLKLEQLKAIYGLGLAPLREALQRLAAGGLVVLEGQRGFRVRSLTIEEAWDIAETRVLLETRAIKLSLAHGDDHWEARVIAAAYRLGKLDAQLSRGIAEVGEAWREANRDFHNATVEACPSAWTLRLRDSLFDQHEQYRYASLVEKAGRRDVTGEHERIRDAVVARDADLAARLMADHIRRLAEGFESWVKRQSSASLSRDATAVATEPKEGAPEAARRARTREPQKDAFVPSKALLGVAGARRSR